MQRAFLPIVQTPRPPNPFGFDLSIYSTDSVLQYGQATNPRWARSGDVLWSKVEPVRGGGYRWDSLKLVENNIRRLRAAGIEPTMIIQQSPAWAQSVPGRLCSPPKPEYLEDFDRFVAAVISRYASGPLQVNYWEIWNEPDVRAQDTSDNAGVGCWVDETKPDRGGAYYGQVLKRIYPVIKWYNPQATVLAGSLLYDTVLPNDPRSFSQPFLNGMLQSGAGGAFDGLSFHAYGEYGPSSLLLVKVLRIREQLATYGLTGKPLYATEIATICAGFEASRCEPNYNEWMQRQANFAARIYAEALALRLEGAFWYSLSNSNPGFRFSQLIDEHNNAVMPRPSYYAFRNSSQLLEGARYVGPPMKELNDSQLEEVQQLTFRRGTSTLYVLWVPRLDFPKIPYEIRVPPGATAICTQSLHLETPSRYMCSDTNKDGVLRLAIGPLPYYVEVIE